jgi:NitT/TauT family transport system substrate-binding protein
MTAPSLTIQYISNKKRSFRLGRTLKEQLVLTRSRLQQVIWFALTLGLSAQFAYAAEPASIQLKWVYQAQFAGYIVAQQKGYYTDHGLTVTIRPGGPDTAASQILASGGVDFAVDWLPSALAAREKGVNLVNVAQFFARAGGVVTCWRSSGIATPADFRHKTIGVPLGGSEYSFTAWASRLRLSTSGTDPDIKIIKLGFNVDPLLQHQADCLSTQIYNEFYQILDAGIKPDQLIVFAYADYDVDTLEDGLYVLQSRLADPAFAAKAARFVAASIEGWTYAVAHPEEAAKIIVDNDPAGVANYPTQLRQMKEIAKLVSVPGRAMGNLDPEAFDRTVGVLMNRGSKSIITQKPEDAWTHAVWARAQAELK